MSSREKEAAQALADLEQYLTPGHDGRRRVDFDTLEKKREGNIEIDFDLLLEEKRRLEKENDEIMSGHYWVDTLEKNGKLDQVYDRIIRRLREETNYFHELEEINLYAEVLSGLDHGEVADFLVTWEAKTNMAEGFQKVRKNLTPEQLSNVESAGYNNPLAREIKIYGNKPNKNAILKSLCTDGTLPASVQTWAHEFTHTTQHGHPGHDVKDAVRKRDVRLPLPQLLKTIWFLVKEGAFFPSARKGELAEAHAYRQGDGALGPRRTTREFLEIFLSKSGKNAYPNMVLDKLLYAITAVDRLDALGFSSLEIGQIIQHAGSWTKKAQYPGVEKAIQEKMDELDLDGLDVETLLDAHKMERDIARLRAQKIAGEEVYKMI